MAVRLAVVNYLNARPLVHVLDAERGRFAMRFGCPSQCAALLHDGHVDAALIPSIEYPRGSDYRIVPDVAIVSHGPVASVALFSRRPRHRIGSVAVDSSSRTSVALLRILCAKRFGIAPTLVTMAPDLLQMLGACDAALVIGDAAWCADHEALGVEKIDLGEEWAALTDLPFVYAFWAGRAGALSSADAAALADARDAGCQTLRDVSRAYFIEHPSVVGANGEIGPWIDRGAVYLRENLKYGLGEREQAGLRRFYELAAELQLISDRGTLRFYECA